MQSLLERENIMEVIYCDKDLSWDILDMDRTSAIIICNGNLYESEIDHQDCLMQFMADYVREQGWNLDDEKDHGNAIRYTDNAFRNGELHGFDVFSNSFESYLISHYPQTLENEDVYTIALNFAKENNMLLGSFQDRSRLGNSVKLVKI